MTNLVPGPLWGIVAAIEKAWLKADAENDEAIRSACLRLYVAVTKENRTLGLDPLPLELARTDGSA